MPVFYTRALQAFELLGPSSGYPGTSYYFTSNRATGNSWCVSPAGCSFNPMGANASLSCSSTGTYTISVTNNGQTQRKSITISAPSDGGRSGGGKQPPIALRSMTYPNPTSGILNVKVETVDRSTALESVTASEQLKKEILYEIRLYDG